MRKGFRSGREFRRIFPRCEDFRTRAGKVPATRATPELPAPSSFIPLCGEARARGRQAMRLALCFSRYEGAPKTDPSGIIPCPVFPLVSPINNSGPRRNRTRINSSRSQPRDEDCCVAPRIGDREAKTTAGRFTFWELVPLTICGPSAVRGNPPAGSVQALITFRISWA